MFKDSNGKTRKINFFFKDDGYDAARTIPLVDELLDSEKVFTVMTRRHPVRVEGVRQDQPALCTPPARDLGLPGLG